MFGSDKVKVGTWVAIRDGCPISYFVNGSANADFYCGPEGDGFEFEFESEALREFVRLADEALRDMDAQFASEEAERAAAGQPTGADVVTSD